MVSRAAEPGEHGESAGRLRARHRHVGVVNEQVWNEQLAPYFEASLMAGGSD